MEYTHDQGCRYGRESDGGHSDAARRIADTWNLHRAAGARTGQVIAVRLADGTGGKDVYASKAEAVRYCWPFEDLYAYLRIAPVTMTVCEAASVLRWQRQAAALKLHDRDYPRGGREVIPRLTQEHNRRQLAALSGHLRMPVALGYPKEPS